MLNNIVWDYKNRLISSTVSSNTDNYTYDHNNIRTTKTNNTATTTYPNMYYNTDGATVTKHIFNPITGDLLATVEGNGTATTTNYIHTDHLGGTNVVTDENGDVVETTDYYPFGEQRVATGSFDEQRKFTGHEFDSDTDLTYAKQRYYDQDVGRWLSQDVVFLNMGVDSRTGNALRDPQSLNSYSYARNNPVNLVDLQGEWFKEWAFGFGSQSTADFRIEVGRATEQMTEDNSAWNFAVDHPYTSGAIVGVGSIPSLVSGQAAGVSLVYGTFYKGVGLSYALTKLAESVIYGYLAQDMISSTIPSVLGTANSLESNGLNLKDVGSITYDVGSSFVPGALGENSTIGATMEVFNFTQSVGENFSKD